MSLWRIRLENTENGRGNCVMYTRSEKTLAKYRALNKTNKIIKFHISEVSNARR